MHCVYLLPNFTLFRFEVFFVTECTYVLYIVATGRILTNEHLSGAHSKETLFIVFLPFLSSFIIHGVYFLIILKVIFE